MRGDPESEAIREKHSALALKLLEDAEREIAAGDTVQGGRSCGARPARPSRRTAPATAFPTAGTPTAVGLVYQFEFEGGKSGLAERMGIN